MNGQHLGFGLLALAAGWFGPLSSMGDVDVNHGELDPGDAYRSAILSGVLERDVMRDDRARADLRGLFHRFNPDTFNAYVNGPIGAPGCYDPAIHGSHRGLTRFDSPYARASERVRDWNDDQDSFFRRIAGRR